MVKEVESKDARILQIIQHRNNPVALKMKTTNTEAYSAFTAVDLLTYIHKGSLTLFNANEELHLPEGSCFITPRFSDYKIQRQLNIESGNFVSYGAILPTSCFNFSQNQNEKVYHKSAIEHLTIPTEKVFNSINILKTHFKLKKAFNNEELTELFAAFKINIDTVVDEDLYPNILSRNDPFLSFLYAHITKNINQDELAKTYGVSTSSFFRLARKKLGMSPYKWLQDQRIHYARFQMQLTALPISKIYMDLGYEDLAHFSRVFKNKFGYNPSETYNTVAIEIIS